MSREDPGLYLYLSLRSSPPPPPPFILAQERVPSMSTAVGSNLISSYLIDCPPSRPTGNPAAFFCRQKNISLLINLSTGICVWTKAGKSISMSLVQLHLFLPQSFPSLCLPLLQPTPLASHLPLLRLVTLMTSPHAPGGPTHEEAAL